MTRFWRNSILAVVAMLCLGLIVSGAGLKLPALTHGAGADAQERAPVVVIDGGDREVLPSARGDREALIQTDRAWYAAGEVIIVTGSGFDAGEAVSLVLHAEPGLQEDQKITVIADAFGNIWDNQLMQEVSMKGVTYYLTAKGESSGLTTQATMANPSADLDQCANDPSPSPSTDGCAANASQWVNGNLGSSKTVYFEGDSIPYRMKFGSLSLGSHTVTIEWDTTKSGKHAIDTTFLCASID